MRRSLDTVRNWAGNLTFSARRVVEPGSVEELQALVRRAADEGRALHAVGAAHSFSAVADGPGDQVSLRNLPSDVEIDRERGVASATGSTTLAELCPALDAAGQALPALPSLLGVTLAGAVATATHGSGDGLQTLAGSVVAMEWVDATGELRRAEVAGPDAPPWAEGLPVSLGSFGIVTRLWLRTVPAYALAQVVYERVALDELLASLPEVLAGAYSVSAFTRWREEEGSRIWCKRRVATGGQVGPEPGRPPWWARTPADGPRHPVPGMPPDRCTPQRGLPGPWHERLPHFLSTATPSMGNELQSEYFVGRDHATAAGEALRTLATDRSSAFVRALAVSELRSVAGDRRWLSPAFERDSIAFHFTWLDEPDTVAPAIEAVEELLAPFDPRPHWGKLFGVRPASLRARLPRLGEAAELRRCLDPAGLFSNDFTRDVLRG